MHTSSVLWCRPWEATSMEQRSPLPYTLISQSKNAHMDLLDRFILSDLLAHSVTMPNNLSLQHTDVDNLLFSAFAWQEKIHLYPVVDSTNSVARQAVEAAIKEAPLHHPNGSLTSHGRKLHGSLFLAEHQTAGRGRQGRSFYSPSSVGLYLSIVVVPPGGIQDPALITATAALAVCQALKQVYGIAASIKWVNDIFYQGKKICGILTEGVADQTQGSIPAAIIGIGVNVAQSMKGFPQELEGIAGTVLPPGDSRLQRNQLTAAIVQHLMTDLSIVWQQHKRHHSAGGIMEEYRRLSILKPGQKVEVFPLPDSSHQSYAATVLGIDHRARLQVQLEDGSQRLLESGEVSLRSEHFTG